MSFGHDTCTSCKGTGRAPKHTNRQHDERTKFADWSECTDRNKRPPVGEQKPNWGKGGWKLCDVRKHWGGHSTGDYHGDNDHGDRGNDRGD